MDDSSLFYTEFSLISNIWQKEPQKQNSTLNILDLKGSTYYEIFNTFLRRDYVRRN